MSLLPKIVQDAQKAIQIISFICETSHSIEDKIIEDIPRLSTKDLAVEKRISKHKSIIPRVNKCFFAIELLAFEV